MVIQTMSNTYNLIFTKNHCWQSQ